MTKSLTETQLFLEAFKDDEDLSQTLHDLASKYNYLCAEQVHADIECQDTIAEDMQQFPLKAAETLRDQFDIVVTGEQGEADKNITWHMKQYIDFMMPFPVAHLEN